MNTLSERIECGHGLADLHALPLADQLAHWRAEAKEWRYRAINWSHTNAASHYWPNHEEAASNASTLMVAMARRPAAESRVDLVTLLLRP